RAGPGDREPLPGQRRGTAGRAGLRRAVRRRAVAARRADARDQPGRPHAPVAPPAPQARRTAHRYEIDLAAGTADRWGCVPADFTRTVAAAAPAGGPVRHLR